MQFPWTTSYHPWEGYPESGHPTGASRFPCGNPRPTHVADHLPAYTEYSRQQLNMIIAISWFKALGLRMKRKGVCPCLGKNSSEEDFGDCPLYTEGQVPCAPTVFPKITHMWSRESGEDEEGNLFVETSSTLFKGSLSYLVVISWSDHVRAVRLHTPESNIYI